MPFSQIRFLNVGVKYLYIRALVLGRGIGEAIIAQQVNTFQVLYLILNFQPLLRP